MSVLFVIHNIDVMH
jgi:hypothetical protein